MTTDTISRLMAVGGLLAFAWTARAQVGTATLSGVVMDATGASIPKAEVKLESTLQKFSRQTLTNVQGVYVIPAIPPGTYALTVTATGFGPETRTGVSLSSGQASTLNLTLSVAAAAEQVTVSEAPPLLQTSNATVGSVVEAKAVRELPLLGRNFTALIKTLPGVAPEGGDAGRDASVGTSTNPSVYGQRQRDNNYTLDGGSNNDLGAGGVPAIFPPPEAIAEMKVESGMTSGAFGVASGANINIVSKSGTKELHGDLWEFLRNNALDARSYFVPSLGAFRWNQFGGAVGGPVVIPRLVSKEKGWYFFGYYEGIRIRRAANFLQLVPTPEELAGNFAGSPPIFNPYSTVTDATGRSSRQPFPNNQVPANLLNQSALTIAKAVYPAPNLPLGQIPGRNFINSTPNKRLQNQWSGKVDHQFSPKDNFSARYSDSYVRNITFGLPALTSDTFFTLRSLILSETHTLDPTFLVTARFGIGRRNRGSVPQLVEGLARRAALLDAYPPYRDPASGRVYEVFPPITIPGYAGMSESISLPSPETQVYWTADANKVRSSHTLEVGGTFYMYYHNSLGLPGQFARFESVQTSNFVPNTGSPLASYVLGLPAMARRTVGSSDGSMYGNSHALYFQDTFRATHKLTLNLGLRYDYAAPRVNKLGSSGFIYDTGFYFWNKKNPITGEAANISPGVIPPDRNNLAPRVGIAYQLSPSTVLRSGFAIFYNLFGANYSQAQQGNRGNWPFAFPEIVTGLNTGMPTAFFQNPFPGPPTASKVPLGFEQNLNAYKDTSRVPYTEQWTFSVQRQLTKTLMTEAVYFGSHSLKLTGQIVDNTAVRPGPGSFKDRQRYPQFSPYVSNGHNIFPAYYHGMSLKIDKRFSGGLTFLASYTWSKNIDYIDSLANEGRGVTENPTRFNQRRFKGPAGFDVPHRFVLSYIYEFPLRTQSSLANAVISNWAISGIVSVDSGLPYGPVLAFDNENIGSAGRTNQFPNVAGNPKVSDPTPNLWFNTAAFVVPPMYTEGNVGRNVLRGDGLSSSDFSAFKRWAFRENRYVEVRAEFFNLFNQTTFGYPGIQVGTPQYGKVAGTRNSGRSIQFGLKLHF